MSKLLKLCLILVLCSALLLVVGCSNQGTESGETNGQSESQQSTETAGKDDAAPTTSGNPEGDPFDAMTDPTGEGDSEDDPAPSEPQIGIDQNTEPTEDDFVVDFDDLT